VTNRAIGERRGLRESDEFDHVERGIGAGDLKQDRPEKARERNGERGAGESLLPGGGGQL